MKVTIEEHRSLLRLRLNDGKRRCISLGVANSTVGNALAISSTLGGVLARSNRLNE
jgi:hypothetical protein